MTDSIRFEDALEDTDIGLIICTKTGTLKGMWIPDSMNEQVVPENIVRLCCDYFGIDPNDFDRPEYLN